MENNILDEELDNDYPRFAIKSYHQFLYASSILAGLLLVSFIFRGNFGGPLDLLYSIWFLFYLGVNFIGVINIVKSIRRKERNHWKKYVGGIGNLILFLVFFIMISILIMDIYTVFIQ